MAKLPQCSFFCKYYENGKCKYFEEIPEDLRYEKRKCEKYESRFGETYDDETPPGKWV